MIRVLSLELASAAAKPFSGRAVSGARGSWDVAMARECLAPRGRARCSRTVLVRGRLKQSYDASWLVMDEAFDP